MRLLKEGPWAQCGAHPAAGLLGTACRSKHCATCMFAHATAPLAGLSRWRSAAGCTGKQVLARRSDGHGKRVRLCPSGLGGWFQWFTVYLYAQRGATNCGNEG